MSVITHSMGDLTFSQGEPPAIGPAAGGVIGTNPPSLIDNLTSIPENLAQAGANLTGQLASGGLPTPSSFLPSKTTIVLVVLGGAAAIVGLGYLFFRVTEPARRASTRMAETLAEHPEVLLGA